MSMTFRLFKTNWIILGMLLVLSFASVAAAASPPQATSAGKSLLHPQGVQFASSNDIAGDRQEAIKEQEEKAREAAEERRQRLRDEAEDHDEEARERLNEMHESLRQEGQDRMENARQERKKRRERLLEGEQERDLFFK